MTRPLAVRAFSLIELLVAMAIASVIMLLLVQFIQMCTTAVVTGEDSLYRTNDAQAALDILSGDLRSLKLIAAPVTSTAATSPPEILQVYNDTGGVTISKTAFVKAQSKTIYPNRLYLLAYSAGSDGKGSGFPHLIAYRVAWQDPLPNDSGNEPILALYRDYVSQNDTFNYTASSDQQINAVGIAGLTNLYSTYWNVNGAFANQPPPVADLLVGNVIDFEVYFYDVGSSTPTKPLNPSSAAPASQYLQGSSSSGQAEQVDLSSSGLFINQLSFPANVTATAYSSLVAEVKITILTNKGVEIMNSGGLAVTDPNLLNRYARTYVRRVPLNLQ